MKEQWKKIKDFCFYEVSNIGRVRSVGAYRINSLGHKRFIRGKILSGFIDDDGYRKVILYKKEKGWKSRKTKTVHSLVLEAFSGPRKGRIARHLDGNPKNNKIENLKWGSPKENCKDRKNHGREYKPPKGHNHLMSCLSSKDVEKIKSLKGKIKQFECAELFKCSRVTIYRIWTGKRYV